MKTEFGNSSMKLAFIFLFSNQLVHRDQFLVRKINFNYEFVRSVRAYIGLDP